MRVNLPQTGVRLEVLSPNPHLRDERMLSTMLATLIETKVPVTLPTPLTAELSYDSGTLQLRRLSGYLLIEWFSRPPEATGITTSLGLWLRGCAAGIAPVGQMRSGRDLPALVVDPRGLLLLRIHGPDELVAVRPEGCDLMGLRQALAAAWRGRQRFVVTSPCSAELEDGDGCYILHLAEGVLRVTRAVRPIAPNGVAVEPRRFLGPVLYGRDGVRTQALKPEEIGIYNEVAHFFRRRPSANPAALFLHDLWATETTILPMSLERRSWVVQAKPHAWFATISGGRLNLVSVTDRRFDLHRFRNNDVVLTEHGDERFRSRIASEWELLVSLPHLRRNLDTKFLLQRLKGQRHVVAADFGYIAVLATPEVTAIFRVRHRSAIVLSVWPATLDHPRGVEEAVRGHLREIGIPPGQASRFVAASRQGS